ncbi:MAG: hypothetical protein J6S53_11860, partial [Lentisphaeria bacterium]|nr:hypothetical protein [Lentisphaeria bacterium]
MSKKSFIIFAALVLAAFTCTADFQLVKDGKSQCNIVVKKGAPLPLAHGAKELALFTEKVTTAKIPVKNEAVKNANNIFIGTIADKDLLKNSGIDAKKLKEDGFALAVKKNTVCIIGQNPRGALYGCYEILKKYAGVRFLAPGEDGTYYPSRKTISIPEQNIIRNPYMRYRTYQCATELSGRAEINGSTFLTRNNLFSYAGARTFADKNGKRTRLADKFESVAAKRNINPGNSHIFTDMMTGWQGAKASEKLYKEHPEYFPLINGKRVFIKSGVCPNPCISNPALLDLMAKNLYERLNEKYAMEDTYITIGNNDTPIWCQ